MLRGEQKGFTFGTKESLERFRRLSRLGFRKVLLKQDCFERGGGACMLKA